MYDMIDFDEDYVCQCDEEAERGNESMMGIN